MSDSDKTKVSFIVTKSNVCEIFGQVLRKEISRDTYRNHKIMSNTSHEVKEITINASK